MAANEKNESETEREQMKGEPENLSTVDVAALVRHRYPRFDIVSDAVRDAHVEFDAMVGQILRQKEARLAKPKLRTVDAIPERKRALNSVLDRCERDPNTGCWLWTGATGKNGYGRVKIDGKLYLPHRVVAFGVGKVNSMSDPSRKACIMHRCDTRGCCNPAHLDVGTLKENMMDCAAKGRVWTQQPGGPEVISKSWDRRRKRKLHPNQPT